MLAPDLDRRTKEVQGICHGCGEQGAEDYPDTRQNSSPDGTQDVWKISDWDKVHRMREALMANPVAEQLLRRTDTRLSEQVLTWTDTKAGTGLPCKARLDMYDPERKVLVDLKSAVDASIGGFRRSIIKFKYDIQSAWYTDGLEAIGKESVGFIHIAIEKDPPYAIGIYMIADDWLEAARYDYINLMKLYNECMVRNTWPAYQEKIVTLPMPEYRKPLELIQL